MMKLIGEAQSPARGKKSLRQVDSSCKSPQHGKRKRLVEEEGPTAGKIVKHPGSVVDESFSTPAKLQERQMAVIAEKSEETKDSADECSVLSVLFAGLDVVLRLLDSRNIKPFLPVVRRDVEAFTGRDLNDFRFAGILGLAYPSMIAVRWVGFGHDAKLEVCQRAKDGEVRAPTADEQRQRKEAFDAALAVAAQRGKLVRGTLPDRPEAPSQIAEDAKLAAPHLPEPLIVKVDSKGLTNAQRREALLARVRLRAAAGSSEEAKEYEDFRRKIVVCDNAMTAHSVLQSLFARGEGKASAASKGEALSALCSTTFGMQSVRQLNKDAAEKALELLCSKADSWFTVVPGVHDPTNLFFRRVPKGSSCAALVALQSERRDLDKQLRELCDYKKRELDNKLNEMKANPMLALQRDVQAQPQARRSPDTTKDTAATKQPPAAQQQREPLVAEGSKTPPSGVAAPMQAFGTLLKRKPAPASQSASDVSPVIVAATSIASTVVPIVAQKRAANEMSQSSTDGLVVGALVEICGLQSRADLNGRKGFIASLDQASGRFAVQLVGAADAELVNVKPGNMKVKHVGQRLRKKSRLVK